jgi:hypothetical protein
MQTWRCVTRHGEPRGLLAESSVEFALRDVPRGHEAAVAALAGDLDGLEGGAPAWTSAQRVSCISIYVSVCLSIRLSVSLSLCRFICLPVYLSVCLPVYLSICLPVYLSICLSVDPSTYLYLHIHIHLVSLVIRIDGGALAGALVDTA